MTGIIKISGCSDSGAAMEAVAAAEFGSIGLASEPEFISSAGDGTPVDLILSYYGQDAAQSQWEYYKVSLSDKPGSMMKAWLHWNGQEFDGYLKCDASPNDSGFTTHTMPYIQR
jgi:hypothetical protein